MFDNNLLSFVTRSIMDFRKQNLDAFVKKYGIKLGFMSVFAKACAYALQSQPIVNAVIEGDQIIYRDYVDISVAVATPKGLVVPVLRNVEQMSYADIELALAALAEKAKQGMTVFITIIITFSKLRNWPEILFLISITKYMTFKIYLRFKLRKFECNIYITIYIF